MNLRVPIPRISCRSLVAPAAECRFIPLRVGDPGLRRNRRNRPYGPKWLRWLHLRGGMRFLAVDHLPGPTPIVIQAALPLTTTF
jgi:hypothetical protein